jgi:hypothetical protein
MTGEIIFMAVLAIGAGAILWRNIRRKSKKSCCD